MNISDCIVSGTSVRFSGHKDRKPVAISGTIRHLPKGDNEELHELSLRIPAGLESLIDTDALRQLYTQNIRNLSIEVIVETVLEDTSRPIPDDSVIAREQFEAGRQCLDC